MKALIHFKSMAETCCVTSQPRLRALGSGYTSARILRPEKELA